MEIQPDTLNGNLTASLIKLEMIELSEEGSKLSLTVYPINPLGQKLQFGARKGVPRKVMSWFVAHVKHRLG